MTPNSAARPRVKKVDVPLSTRQMIEAARVAFLYPPRHDHIERPPVHGERVAEFVLPLDLCKSFNVVGRKGSASAGWALGKMKQAAYHLMRVQNGGRKASEVLGGRPQIRVCRFSSVEPDREAGWCKNPVDRLRATGRNGLGFIVDDGPRFVDLATWWEPAPPKKGFVWLEIRTGKPVAQC